MRKAQLPSARSLQNPLGEASGGARVAPFGIVQLAGWGTASSEVTATTASAAGREFGVIETLRFIELCVSDALL